MNSSDNTQNNTTRSSRTRRDFLRTASVVAAGGALTPALIEGTSSVARGASLPGAYATGSDAIKVGVIGCGGRGTGAARNVLDAFPDVKVVALADAFKDQVDYSLEQLKQKYADRVDVPPARQFAGIDAYKNIIASDVNYIILATPPAFRPQHLRLAVNAGKHVFAEKPIATDAAGIRECFAIYDEAVKKGIGIAAGTQRRHQAGYIETMKRIHDGAIGEIVSARAYWNQGYLWSKPRQPGMSDVEWQLRNWNYFTWLSGDHIVEQHIHNIDVVNWAMQAHPIKAVSLGGRQARTDELYGNVFDHFTTDYEYANGVHMMSQCRQQENTTRNVSEALVGTKGRSQVNRYLITGHDGTEMFRRREKETDPYIQEHIDLITSIRAGKPINELKNVAESTLTAIMGRMSAYTGQEVTWEQALNSKQDLVPRDLTFGPKPVEPVAVPGKTELA